MSDVWEVLAKRNGERSQEFASALGYAEGTLKFIAGQTQDKLIRDAAIEGINRIKKAFGDETEGGDPVWDRITTGGE